MPKRLAFLVIDDVPDNRFLLTRTLCRKFPGCQIAECTDYESALNAGRQPGLAVAIIHRTEDVDGLSIIAQVRKENPSLPILSVSGYDRREAAVAAGANAFLHYDAWLSVGTVIDELLRSGTTQNPFATPSLDKAV